MRRPSNDVLLLFVLLLARVRIDTLAEWAAIPTDMLQNDVARLLRGFWPSSGLVLLADRQTTDPVTLVLTSLSFGLFFVYLAADAFRDWLSDTAVYRLKMGLLGAIVVVLVLGQTVLFTGLRHVSGPATYAHDGGVIQTEVTIEYLLAGVNPYVADYLDTPMADWGTEYRTALHHFPYLPWTFLFSAPFYLSSRFILGWFDQRWVYLLLFAATLVLAHSLARNRGNKLSIVMVMGLNPILASDMIFGQNDSFVLFWIVLGIWLLCRAENQRGRAERPSVMILLSLAAFGLACASKPTAWFLVPFLALFVLGGNPGIWNEGFRWPRKGILWVSALARHMWPLVLVFIVVVGPWFLWNPGAMMDDVWRWSAGTADTPYQIRGWGFSNFVLALGLVPDRLAYWPFWIVEVLVAGPLFVLLLWRQARHNSLSSMLSGYVVLLFGFLYASRFLNENYLGYLLSLLALAVFVAEPDDQCLAR